MEEITPAVQSFTRSFPARYLWRIYGEIAGIGLLVSLAGIYFYYDFLFLSDALTEFSWLATAMILLAVTGAGLAAHRYVLRRAYTFFKITSVQPMFADASVISEIIGGEITAYPFRIITFGLIVPAYALILINETAAAVVSSASPVIMVSNLIQSIVMGTLLLAPLAVTVFLTAENRMIALAHELVDAFPVLCYVREDQSGFLNYRIKLIIQITVPVLAMFCFFTWVTILPVEEHLKDVYHIKAVLLLFAVIGLMGYLAWAISYSLTRPVQDVQEYLKQFLRHRGNGQTLNRFGFFLSDERGQLGHMVMNLMQEWIPVMEQLQKHRAEIQQKSEDILNASRYETGVAYNQASALSQLSSTVEELVHSVNQISTDAVLAATMAQSGMKEIEHGRDNLDKTLQSIDHIYQEALASSQRIMDLSLKMVQIEDVIRIINYVTDHTKILAFNAAIETATAGEMGERFGVVAKEIRQLAQNISDSTEEIKKIIGDVKKTSHVSVLAMEKELKQVNNAVRNATDAQQSFQEIHASIRQVTDSIGNISVAIQQQRIAHEQVWTSIKDLDVSAKELHKKSQKMVDVSDQLQGLSRQINTELSSSIIRKECK